MHKANFQINRSLIRPTESNWFNKQNVHYKQIHAMHSRGYSLVFSNKKKKILGDCILFAPLFRVSFIWIIVFIVVVMIFMSSLLGALVNHLLGLVFVCSYAFPRSFNNFNHTFALSVQTESFPIFYENKLFYFRHVHNIVAQQHSWTFFASSIYLFCNNCCMYEYPCSVATLFLLL